MPFAGDGLVLFDTHAEFFVDTLRDALPMN